MSIQLNKNLKFIKDIATCVFNEDRTFGFELGLKVAEDHVADYLSGLDLTVPRDWDEIIDNVRTGKYADLLTNSPELKPEDLC